MNYKWERTGKILQDAECWTGEAISPSGKMLEEVHLEGQAAQSAEHGQNCSIMRIHEKKLHCYSMHPYCSAETAPV